MEIKQLFEEASIRVKTLPNQSNDTLLSLYSLFKQSTEGDVSGEEPTNPFDFVGRAKFQAWHSLKGMSTEEAMNKYVALVNSLN